MNKYEADIKLKQWGRWSQDTISKLGASKPRFYDQMLQQYADDKQQADSWISIDDEPEMEKVDAVVGKMGDIKWDIRAYYVDMSFDDFKGVAIDRMCVAFAGAWDAQNSE